MASNILFLGTGGDSVVVGKQRRGSGGIVISAEGYQFHLDPGPGALVRAKELGVNLRGNTAVLVSHNHINHANDVNAVISAMTYDGLDRAGVLICAESVVDGYEKKNHSVPGFLMPKSKDSVERVIKLKSTQKVGIEDIEIHALKTNHLDPHCIGFKFFTSDFVLSYSSDTAYAPYIANEYKGSDIIILNVVHPAGEKSSINLSTDDAIKIISKVKPKMAVMTHFGNKMLEHDPIYEIRKIQKETGTQVIAAKDGLSIDPISYSAQMKQRTLNLYSKQ